MKPDANPLTASQGPVATQRFGPDFRINSSVKMVRSLARHFSSRPRPPPRYPDTSGIRVIEIVDIFYQVEAPEVFRSSPVDMTAVCRRWPLHANETGTSDSTAPEPRSDMEGATQWLLRPRSGTVAIFTKNAEKMFFMPRASCMHDHPAPQRGSRAPAATAGAGAGAEAEAGAPAAAAAKRQLPDWGCVEWPTGLRPGWPHDREEGQPVWTPQLIARILAPSWGGCRWRGGSPSRAS